MQKAARFGKSAIRIGVAVFVLLCRSALAETSVGFKVVADRFVVVPVLVNGQNPFNFLLDTGTNTTVVDLELALARYGACWDSNSCPGYLLSYKDRRLEFVEPEATEGRFRGVPLSFDSEEGRIVVAAAAASSHANARRLVLDSGASNLVLFDRQSRGLGSDVEEHAGAVAALPSEGSLELRMGSIHRLDVGGQRFDDLPVILVPHASGMEERTQDGLLPTSLFRAVYFNNRDGFVLLNPRR